MAAGRMGQVGVARYASLALSSGLTEGLIPAAVGATIILDGVSHRLTTEEGRRSFARACRRSRWAGTGLR